MSKRSARVSGQESGRRLLRRLPSVERLLSSTAVAPLEREFGRKAVTAAVRTALAALRARVLAGEPEDTIDAAVADLPSRVGRILVDELRPSLRTAVNATGILIHTNLGRAPLSPRAVRALNDVAGGYTNLELDLETGKRGSRHRHAARLLSKLFPEKSAVVVNNAAAAVMLSLNTFASGKEVVISRGELVEIGGSFRVPDILARSGARLREVGTTNKTRLADYERAIGPETAVILRVHPSNFKIVGFTESASMKDLVRLGNAKGLTVIEDFGSGNLISLEPYGLPEEPTVHASLTTGVHLTIFSGDKLLGGPQAGILVGDAAHIASCRENPMARALRVDKLTYAALEATLLSFLEDKATEEIPVLRMLATPAEAIRARAQSFVERLGPGAGALHLSVEPSTSRVGGGAAADAEIPTFVVTVTSETFGSDDIANALRTHEPPIIGRVSEDRVLLDLRTVAPEEEEVLANALTSLTKFS